MPECKFEDTEEGYWIPPERNIQDGDTIESLMAVALLQLVIYAALFLLLAMVIS